MNIANPAQRIALALGATLLVLSVVIATVRPEMMGMAMIRNLIVGFGL